MTSPAPEVRCDPTPDVTADPAPLDFAALDAAYVSPTYLRTPLREFLLTTDRGLYWLRAPAGIGKTAFVRGIIARRPGRDPAVLEGIDSTIASDIRAIGVHVQGPLTPHALVTALKDAFAAEFGVALAEAASAEPTGADVLALLGAARDHLTTTGAKRLLVAIDGLERIADGGAIAVLPAAAEMPPGVVLLLTSRPAADWPQGLFEAMTAQVGGGAVVRDIGYEDSVYTDMLRGYFKNRIRPLMRSRAIAHLTHLLETKASFERGGRDNRLTNDPLLRDALKDDWKKLTNKHPRYSGIQLPVVPLVEMLDQFDQLWVDLIDRADRRFDGVSAIIGALAAGSLQVEEVAGLPTGPDLHARLGIAQAHPVP
ncbi:hypothetical protein K9U40_05850 [Xanthobacter autotrophicus]|uniref:hypothetical protein n=1 Tax=Xanthobacter TaxID=279 RepID=UPI0024AA7B6E|nr:hypothetical protein [Xanthobacter autotrophicus]MDI4663851.1 hypothetical protein [Xanthobacter autotrophicus]